MNIYTNSDNLENHKIYTKLILSIHSFLQSRGYTQLELPVLSPALIPESYLEVFETEFHYLNQTEKLYLTPSPELFIKRLLSQGIGDCYYLGKSFRNSEPNSPKHTSEFTMLEFYKVKKDYKFVAEEVMQMFRHIASDLFGDPSQIVYQNQKISLEQKEELTVAEAFQKYASIDQKILFDHNEFISKVKEKGYKTEEFSYEDLFSQMYSHEVEPHLGMHGMPTFLYDYPVEFAALSTPNDDEKTAQRFEVYICGIELGNCYTELADWKKQEERLENEEKERARQGKIEHQSDTGFIKSLKNGLPLCSGIAMGVERMGMLFADVESIEELQVVAVR